MKKIKIKIKRVTLKELREEDLLAQSLRKLLKNGKAAISTDPSCTTCGCGGNCECAGCSGGGGCGSCNYQ